MTADGEAFKLKLQPRLFRDKFLDNCLKIGFDNFHRNCFEIGC